MTNTLKTFVFLSTVLSQVLSNQFTEKRDHFDEKVCENVTEFNDQLRQQLKSISTDAEKILDLVINGEDKGVTYRELAKFVDRFGPRLAGHPMLEHSIDYLVELLRKEQHETVYTEEVQVPRWV